MVIGEATEAIEAQIGRRRRCDSEVAVEETTIEVVAKRFVRTGRASGVSEDRLAAACEAHIQGIALGSLKTALPLARRFASNADGHGGVLRSTAYRMLARVSHMSGMHEDASRAYLAARSLIRNDPLAKARIDRALIDVYMYLGDFPKARKAARDATSVFTRLRSEGDLVRTKVNYANLLHRLDRHRDAERLYREAAEFFDRKGDSLASARCKYNRANALLQLFEVEEAERLYMEARQAYKAAGRSIDANDARYGIAWLLMLTGRFHSALLELDACEMAYRESGDPRGEALCRLDRTEVFLGLGLYEDALEAARKCGRDFAKLSLRYESAKSALFRGQASSALGRRSEAERSMKKAKALFDRERNSGFAGVVHMLAADIFADDDTRRRAEMKAARRKFSRAQLPLWEAYCDVAQAVDPSAARAALARLEKNAAALQVPQLFALWQIAAGDWMSRMNDLDGASKRWRMAADRLDAVRAQLPPLELRSAFAKGKGLPHSRLISLELRRNPPLAAAWSERQKTAGLWSTLPTGSDSSERRRAAESLDALARQVALASGSQAGSAGERSLSEVPARRALSKLQRKVRDDLMSAERSGRNSVDSPEKLIRIMREVSNRIPVVQFHLPESGELIAFVHRMGDLSVSRFEGGGTRLDSAMRRWRFLLEGQLMGGKSALTSSLDAEYTLWSDLGDWLWSPLGIEREDDEILIIPEGRLANLPWQALIVDGAPLGARHRIFLSPSVRHYLASLNVKPGSSDVRLFGGAGDDASYLRQELSMVYRHAGAAAYLHDPCTREDWPQSGDALLWHFAGHAVLRSDNPFYSHLVLDDGPLFAADFRLKQCYVNLVTLASCRSGEQVAMPGEELNGLVRSLLEMGARNVIASRWAVSDKTTYLWMNAFYEKFFGGVSLLDSVGYAEDNVRKSFPSACHWAAFSVFGAGNAGDEHEQ